MTKDFMTPITEPIELAKVCSILSTSAYVTVDTEFLRESTYWPKLCLIQMAGPDVAVTIDAQADGLDLSSFFELMANPKVVKVFHAARQDVEIVWHLGGLIPAPLFDTQVAAMVCGFGDSISYDQLVYKICGVPIDKSSRFTDWSRRPLSDKQLAYALADVTHLRDVYHALEANLAEQNRSGWVAEEMSVLTSPGTYDIKPEDAWRRLKMRVKRPIELAVLRELAALRETEAKRRDVPRNRVFKDDTIYELAIQRPATPETLGHLRTLSKGFERSQMAGPILKAIQKGVDIPPDDRPKIPRGRQSPEGTSAIVELLKVLLKLTVEEHAVAAKIIATVDDLEQIATDDNADVGALQGWRRELFGERALQLKRGELALTFVDKKIAAIPTRSLQ
jgi:ribonuclease D